MLADRRPMATVAGEVKASVVSLECRGDGHVTGHARGRAARSRADAGTLERGAETAGASVVVSVGPARWSTSARR